jgi:hypothetical protein
LLGWREWVALPDLDQREIKAKVETGARTSTLHAFRLRTFTDNGQLKVEFDIHPKQRNLDMVKTCTANVIGEKVVSDSGGHKEQRLVIVTPLVLGAYTWPIEITLTSRDNMLFRMLLGRTAIEGVATVDPSKSYLVGKRPRKARKAPADVGE